MHLTNLNINNFRNIHNLNFQLSPGCNLFYGANGSGKTSILEAIYYLSSGRSFRSHIPARVIQYGCDKFALHVTAKNNQSGLQFNAGIERPLHGSSKIQLQNNTISVTELAMLLPMQLLHQDSFMLLTFGPKYKRKFIDWGMFHVEHNFLSDWKNAKYALEQRNALLKTTNNYRSQKKDNNCKQNNSYRNDIIINNSHANNGEKDEAITTTTNNTIAAWDQEFTKWGTSLHRWREQYLTKLLPIINELLAQLLGNYKIAIHYYAGWNTKENLFDILQSNFNRDQIVGLTQFGPHRADLRLLINDVPVQDCLSRGQQKVFIFILHLAQGLLLKNLTNKSCIYLIDDLAAELDKEYQQKIAALLLATSAQLFITALEQEKLQYLATPSFSTEATPCAMFPL